MISEIKHSFSNAIQNQTFSKLVSLYSDAWLAEMSKAAIAVAIHKGLSNVKNVAYVSHKSGECTISVKFYDGTVVTMRAYEKPVKCDVPYLWQTDVTVKDGAATLH